MDVFSPSIDTLADVAARWRDADYAPRRRAVKKTLEAPNRWTEPALTHALDRWMERLTPEGLRAWLGDATVGPTMRVGILHGEIGRASCRERVYCEV